MNPFSKQKTFVQNTAEKEIPDRQKTRETCVNDSSLLTENRVAFASSRRGESDQKKRDEPAKRYARAQKNTMLGIRRIIQSMIRIKQNTSVSACPPSVIRTVRSQETIKCLDQKGKAGGLRKDIACTRWVWEPPRRRTLYRWIYEPKLTGGNPT